MFSTAVKIKIYQLDNQNKKNTQYSRHPILEDI